MLEPKKPGEPGDGTDALQSGTTQQKTLKEGTQEGTTSETTDKQKK